MMQTILSAITPSLALGDYLMFDHTVRSSARVRKLW